MLNQAEAIKEFVLKAIKERVHGEPELVPSEYWTDFARNFRYVYDLKEDELKRIRFHAYHLTSDSYLTYYFSDESFKGLLKSGYSYFVNRNQLEPIDEGEYGIGVETEFGRISHDLLRYLGVSKDLVAANLLDRVTPRNVIEIGGGYGGLARVHMAQNSKASYFICDLEETLFFSAVYLSNCLGVDRVHLVDKSLKDSEIEPGHVYIVPQSKIEYLDNLRFDYAISQQSLQEMTRRQVERYLAWLVKHATYLYSCNVFDHGDIANSKHLVLNLPALFDSYFASRIWLGDEPMIQERFGDNHLLRAVYKCQ